MLAVDVGPTVVVICERILEASAIRPLFKNITVIFVFNKNKNVGKNYVRVTRARRIRLFIYVRLLLLCYLIVPRTKQAAEPIIGRG